MPRNYNIPLQTLRDIQFNFRNFSGEKTMYNSNGNREFGIVLNPEQAAVLTNAGWPVRHSKPNSDYDEPEGRDYITVRVRFDNFPPKVVLIAGETRQILSEANIGLLDSVAVIKADVVLSPYEWSVKGESGIKAYLKTLYVTIVQDELEAQYGF